MIQKVQEEAIPNSITEDNKMIITTDAITVITVILHLDIIEAETIQMTDHVPMASTEVEKNTKKDTDE
jgi:hypothetical protein